MVSLERLTYSCREEFWQYVLRYQPVKQGGKFMFGSSVKIDADLLKRCKQHAQDAGYSSVEEFVAHVLERELKSKQEESEKDQEEIARRLQGLGYIE